MDWHPTGAPETITLNGHARELRFGIQKSIGNNGTALITLVSTDGTRVTLAPNYAATVVQDADGRFISISAPYLVEPDR